MRAFLLIFVAFLVSACGPVANQAVVKQNNVDMAPASIPITFEGFSSYIDGAKDLGAFEGIWENTSSRNEYTVGIYRDKRDARYPYKAFIINTNVDSWAPGEIKIKFTKLDSSGLALSQYHMRSKLEPRATWRFTVMEQYEPSLQMHYPK